MFELRIQCRRGEFVDDSFRTSLSPSGVDLLAGKYLGTELRKEDENGSFAVRLRPQGFLSNI
jgi:hypothetical protein